ncbi:hypothetical protein NHF45_09295 [Maricaulaceae bacterium NA33B04]|nr:hypothetical protein [Maricaulaceae bacterium NA33B04]
MNDAFQVIASFLGGSFVSGVVVFLLSTNRENRLAFIGRVEKCVLAANKFHLSFVGNFVAYAGVMRGDYSYNDALDMVIKEGAPHAEEIHYFNVMFPIFFPKLKPLYVELMSARDSAAKVSSDFREFYRKTGQPSAIHLKDYVAASDKFNEAYENLIEALGKEAQRATSQFWF